MVIWREAGRGRLRKWRVRRRGNDSVDKASKWGVYLPNDRSRYSMGDGERKKKVGRTNDQPKPADYD